MMHLLGAVHEDPRGVIAVYLGLLVYLIVINVTTFVTYGYDKMIAGSKRRRVSETTLHALALIGGAPAAFLAQRVFRHKSVKRSFQRTFWVIVVIQVGSVIFWWWVYLKLNSG